MSTPSEKPTILLQLDPDRQPSVFDGVVAVDAGVDHLFRHGGVTPNQATGLVHGCIFTRGPADLRRTAIFIGGSDVSAAEDLLKAVQGAFFGPFRVSVLLDPNGANTTAAAAVLAAMKSLGGEVRGAKVAVLAATGPVGRRVARLAAGLGAEVIVSSRQQAKAETLASELAESTGHSYTPLASSNADAFVEGLSSASIVISAGASGVVLLPTSLQTRLPNVKVLIDLNAVPPVGLEGVKPTDRDVDAEGVRRWGALGVGGLKMKIHRRALQTLFEANDKVLDAEHVLELGRSLA